MNKLGVIVLAAGLGTRMRTETPKVLHKLCEKPVLSYILDTIKKIKPAKVSIVAGYKHELVRKIVPVEFKVIIQKKILGTADAVRQCGKEFKNFKAPVLVLCGDVPLLSFKTLNKLVKKHNVSGSKITILTAYFDNPEGYGRIVRDKKGRIIRIVEHKDASPDIKKIKEINSGIYCFDTEFLFKSVKKIKPDNLQKEYYLTDVIEIAFRTGQKIESVTVKDSAEVEGINTRKDLELLSKIIYRETADNYLQKGVTFIDIENSYIGPEVKIGNDTVIYPGVYIHGKTIIGQRTVIGCNTRINNSKIDDDVKIEFSVIENSSISKGTVLPPFSIIKQ